MAYRVWWADTGQQPNIHLLLAHSPLLGDWEKNRKKATRHVDWDNDSVSKKQKLHSQAKKKRGIHSLLHTGRQISSYYLESRASACITVTWEDKQTKHECTPFLLLSLSWAWCYMIWNTTFISLGQLSWLCPFPTSFPPIAYWPWGRGEKALTLCKQCSATAKTLLTTNAKCTTILNSMMKVNFINSSQPDAIHRIMLH